MIRMKGDRSRDVGGRTLDKKWRLASLKLLNAIRRKIGGKDELPVLEKKREAIEENEAKIEVNWKSIGSNKNEFKDSEDSSLSSETDFLSEHQSDKLNYRLEKEKNEEVSFYLTYLFELTPLQHYQWALSKEYPTIKLKKAFENHRYCLPSDVNIEEKRENQWIIESDDFTFLVHKNGKTGTTSDCLKVYLKWNYIFSVVSDIQLSERESIYKYFKKVFKEYGKPLSEDFDVNIDNKKLFIKDQGSKFWVDRMQSGKKLRIYRKKSIEPEGSISYRQEEEITETDDSRSDGIEGTITGPDEQVTVDWEFQETEKKKETHSSSVTEEREERLIKIPDTTLKRCLKEIDVEEQILLFANKKDNGDRFVWRTEKPELEKHTGVFSSCDSKSLHECLKSCEEYEDSFVGLIHKHPSGGKQAPSSTDRETTERLDLCYPALFSGIVGSKNRVLTVFFESEDTKLKVVGDDVKERGEKNGRKFWKVE